MQIYKADPTIINESDFEELEKGLVYIDRQGGFIALVNPEKSDAVLVDLELSTQKSTLAQELT